MKWYILLPSSFMSAMALNRMMAPWRRSALLNAERFDGRDLVRLCLKTPAPLIFAAADARRAFTSPSASDSRPRGARTPSCWNSYDVPPCPAAPPSSRPMLPLSPLLLRPPLLARRHTLPSPYHTKPVIQRASFAKTWPHQRARMPRATRKRSGRMVKVYSHESRHASAPKMSVRSRKGVRSTTLSSRSIFTAADSYGASTLCGRWMYSGLGFCAASSSCRCVGSDRGGMGMTGSRGTPPSGETPPSACDDDDRWSPAACGRRFTGFGSGWNELRRGDVFSALDLRLRFMGGVDSVRGCPCERPAGAVAGVSAAAAWGAAISGPWRIDLRMACRSDGDRRPLRWSASESGTTAMGSECREAARCCIPDAESRRTPSGEAPFLTGCASEAASLFCCCLGVLMSAVGSDGGGGGGEASDRDEDSEAPSWWSPRVRSDDEADEET